MKKIQDDKTKHLKKLGANIRRERVKQQMTQEKFAELSDLSVRSIQRIEKGEMNFLITTAMRIQKSLKCSWDMLLPNG